MDGGKGGVVAFLIGVESATEVRKGVSRLTVCENSRGGRESAVAGHIASSVRETDGCLLVLSSLSLASNL